MSKKAFRGALNRLDLHKKTKEAEIPGILGFTVNGLQVVNVPYRPGYVYVRLRNNTSEVIQAFNENTPALYNLPVIIIRDEVDKSRYKVKGRDLGAYQNWGTSNLYVGDHTHSFFTGFLAFDDAVFIATGVALDFKEDLYATAAGTTISVGVVTGTFSRDGHTHPQYSTGSASVGGGGSTVLIYDDTTFKVTGTAINFGANLNVVVTGSTAYVSSVDTVGGGGGADLLIYDNSVFKATGTAIDFGDNLDVVVTGTYVYVTAVGVTGSVGPAGPQGLEGATGSVGPQGIQGIQGIQGPPGDNTLLIYDDNVFKVTGTALAFGSNINVVVTGSTAFISSVDTTGDGGGITHNYYGYNTGGGSWASDIGVRVFLKSISIPFNGLLSSIGAYVKSDGASHVGMLGAAIYTDNANSPQYLIGYTMPAATSFIPEIAAGNTTARWVDVPLGKYITSGTYWVAVMCGTTITNEIYLAYDWGGTDKYYTPGGTWFSDAGFYAITSTTGTYSIRASFVY